MKIIGITGGIGSGKSEITKIIENNYKAYTVIADQVAYELMQPKNKSYMLIVKYFGEELLTDNNFIDRKKLASIVFSDQEKLAKLNSFVHPYVKENIISQIKLKQEEGNVDYFIIEAALLIEDGYNNICDELWYIYASSINRRRRLKESRGYTDEQIDSIFRNQLSDQEFRDKCKFTIDNNEDIKDVIFQIQYILSFYHNM